MQNNQNSQTLLVGAENGAAALENHLAISTTVEHMYPHASTLGYTPNSNEYTWPPKNIYMVAHGSGIHISHNMN